MIDLETQKGTADQPFQTKGDLDIVIAKGGVYHTHEGSPEVAYAEGITGPVLVDGELKTVYSMLKVIGSIGAIAIATQNGKIMGSGNPRKLKVGNNSAIVLAGNPEIVEVNGSEDDISGALVFGEVATIKMTGNAHVAVYSLNEDYSPDRVIKTSEAQRFTLVRPQDARRDGGEYPRNAIDFLFGEVSTIYRQYEKLILPFTPKRVGVRGLSLRGIIPFRRPED